MQLDLRQQARAAMPPLDGTYSPHLAERGLRTWRGRMVNEYRSYRVFESLAAQMEAARFGEPQVAECRKFAAEERLHGVLCGAVVEALGGEARAEISEPEPVPEHADVSRLEAVLRNVLSICCGSETVAVSLIGAEREDMPPGPLRELLSQIYADEVGHARFGWRLCAEHIPPLDAATKDRLGAYLRASLGHLESHELSHIPLGESLVGGEALGLCSGWDARALFYDTLARVILPQLTALGLDAQRAWDTRLQA
jgi:hypothetical protein